MGNVTLTKNYYQINCTTILEWLENADIMKSEDNDITVTVSTIILYIHIAFVSAYVYDILYKQQIKPQTNSTVMQKDIGNKDNTVTFTLKGKNISEGRFRLSM